MNHRLIFNEDRDEGSCRLTEYGLQGHHIALRFIPEVPWCLAEVMFFSYNKFFNDMIDKLLETGNIKIRFAISCRFRKFIVDADETRLIDQWLSIKSIPVGEYDDLINEGNLMQFNRLIENFTRNGSNWVLDGIQFADWTVVKYSPIAYFRN